MEYYRNQPVFLFDEFYGQVPVQWLKQFCDRTATICEVKGGARAFKPMVVVITTNTTDWKHRWWPGQLPEEVEAFERRITLRINCEQRGPPHPTQEMKEFDAKVRELLKDSPVMQKKD